MQLTCTATFLSPRATATSPRSARATARVLVATDIAARGVHVDGVELVVHVDPPAEHKAYLHRSGRTARAGNAGDVVTVVLPEQRKDTQALDAPSRNPRHSTAGDSRLGRRPRRGRRERALPGSRP